MCLYNCILTERNYSESACEEVLELMRECCRKFKGQSICCEGIDIEPKAKPQVSAKQNQTNS